jgi:hypothetical protein
VLLWLAPSAVLVAACVEGAGPLHLANETST